MHDDLYHACRYHETLTTSKYWITHGGQRCGAGEAGVLLEDIVRSRTKEDEDIDYTALRKPMSVRLRNLLLRLEVGEQFA